MNWTKKRLLVCVCVRVVGKSGGRFWCETHWKRKMNVILLLSVPIIWIECIARCVIFTPIQTPNLHSTHTHTHSARYGCKKLCVKNVTRFVTVSLSTMQWANFKLMQIWMWFDAMRWRFFHSISFSLPLSWTISPFLILHHFCIIIDVYTVYATSHTESSETKCQLTNDIIFYLVRMDWNI